MSSWQSRLRAAAIHLGISLAVAALAAALVFGLWYPYPYREISGGRELFLIVVTVDVLLGPLITLFVFNSAKSRRELRLDLAIVGLLQLAALGYGLWTVAMARPVHLVFEFDRYRVVHRIEVPDELLDKQPAGVRSLPLTGPSLLAVREFKTPEERIDVTVAALRGVSMSSRPDLWQDYAAAVPRVLAAAHPVAELKRRFPASAADIDAVLRAEGRDPAKMLWLPMAGRKSFWTAFVDPGTGDVAAFLPLDSF